MITIGTVVEGPSDRLVLEAILEQIYQDEIRYIPIQPLSNQDFGKHGPGWWGVKKWCEETWQLKGSSLEKLLSGDTGSPLDVLVIQVDAEIAFDSNLQKGFNPIIDDVQQVCPPIQPTIANLKQIIAAGWLQKDDLPPQVILAIPAQDTENWTFAALFPDDALCAAADYECPKLGQHWRDRPGYRLTRKKYGQLLEFKAGKIKKSKRRYEALISQIADNWDTVRTICSQAEQFDQDIRNLLTPEAH